MTAVPAPMVLAEGLVKRYRGREVLAGLDLQVGPGEVVGLLGPNGAGKTTTVRILTTLTRLDAGRAEVAGHDVVHDATGVRQSIGVTGQETSVDEELSGRENLVLIGRLLHLGRRRAAERADELVHQFGLVDHAEHRVRRWSGGLRRRLDLATCLVGAPPVLFLDEPTTGLDPPSRRGLWEAVRAVVTNGTSVLLTTQYLEEADALCDRVVVVDGGRIVGSGTPGELKRRVGDHRLVVTLRFDHDWSAATTILDTLSTASEQDRRRRTLVVSPHGGLDGVGRAAHELAAAGVEVDTFDLRAPTLDDVFDRLTGSVPVGVPATTP